MGKTQQDYEDLLVEILYDKSSITIAEYIDFLGKREKDWKDQQIVRNIISNRFNHVSPFYLGILSYNEKTGEITKTVRMGEVNLQADGLKKATKYSLLKEKTQKKN